MNSKIKKLILPLLIAFPACHNAANESRPTIAQGTNNKLGDVELEYAVAVLGEGGSCTGVALSPRHVLTDSGCLGRWTNLIDEPTYALKKEIEILSFAGGKRKIVRATRAVHISRVQDDVSGRVQPVTDISLFSAVNVVSKVALLVLETDLSYQGIILAKPEQILRTPLKLTGFGVHEDGVFKNPRTAVSEAEWKSTRLDNGYGIVGFSKANGFACDGDGGAPAVSDGFLVAMPMLRNRKKADCASTTSNTLVDLRYLRGGSNVPLSKQDVHSRRLAMRRVMLTAIRHS